MSLSLPTIDFRSIRARDGSQAGGFEQLSVELFSRDLATSTDQILRVDGAGGDGGVEAYVHSDGSAHEAVQAKYFVDRLESTQWRQIDKSVTRVLTCHGDLTEYYVYVALDFSPAEIKEWNQRVVSWKSIPGGENVEFVLRGRSAIELALKSPMNHDLLHYWFGTSFFGDDWMDAQVERATIALDRRYRPALHVASGVEDALDRFAWAPSAEATIEKEFVELADSILEFRRSVSVTSSPGPLVTEVESVLNAADRVIRVEYPCHSGSTVSEAVQVANSLAAETQRLIATRKSDDLASTDQRSASERRIREQGVLLARHVRRWRSELSQFEGADRSCALLVGEAGVGKSHLLANCAAMARVRSQPAILLLGERFSSESPALRQFLDLLGVSVEPSNVLAALNVAAALERSPALILIDAVNESRHRENWKVWLRDLGDEIRGYSHLKLIVSCRRDFLDVCAPKNVRLGQSRDWTLIDHDGLGDVMVDLVARYFDSYGVVTQYFPPVLDEFRNPLFLDLFCQAYASRSIPSGGITLTSVMQDRLRRVAEDIADQIDCDEDSVRGAIESVAQKITDNAGTAMLEEEAKVVVSAYSPSQKRSESLFNHLVSSGLLTMRACFDPRDGVTRREVCFSFERYSDYFIAERLVADVNPESLLRRREEESWCSWLDSFDSYVSNRGVARALAILLPERFGIELAEVVRVASYREMVLVDFLDSLPWRTVESFTDNSLSLVSEAKRAVSGLRFVSALLRLVSIENHPLNADGLSERLFAMTLPARDSEWTLPVSRLASDVSSVASTLVEWALRSPGGVVVNSQARLVATVLLWFGSSNSVAFRSRAGTAAIRLLAGRPLVIESLVQQFDTVDDPYVIERVYAVACGVALRESAGAGLARLATTTSEQVFGQDDVRPHVLLRDYAAAVVRHAVRLGCVEDGEPSSQAVPPYKSALPRVIGEVRAQAIEELPGWGGIADSVRPEGMGIYGDFGRYVMGSAVSDFLSTKKSKPLTQKLLAKGFDLRRARRWVLQRVRALGWTPERFSDHDDAIHDERMTASEEKIERIGKKYQMIALHELVGLLADHYHMRTEAIDQHHEFKGPWELLLRDFDPSAVAEGSVSASVEASGWVHEWDYRELPVDPFARRQYASEPAVWVSEKPSDLARLVVVRQPESDRDWLALGGFWRWIEPRILRIREGRIGRCEMWVHARSWLVSEREADTFIERISDRNLWGAGCSGVSLGQGWLCEYPDGSPHTQVRELCEAEDDWLKGVALPHVRTECDWDRRGSVAVPAPQVLDLLEAEWSGNSASFANACDVVVATCVRLPWGGDSLSAVVSLDEIRIALKSSGLRLIWGILGERRFLDRDPHSAEFEASQFSAVYALRGNELQGGITRHVVAP